MADEGTRLAACYELTDEESGETAVFGKMMAAHEEGQRRAETLGLSIEGWRQERPNVWYLLPDRRFSITLRVQRK